MQADRQPDKRYAWHQRLYGKRLLIVDIGTFVIEPVGGELTTSPHERASSAGQRTSSVLESLNSTSLSSPAHACILCQHMVPSHLHLDGRLTTHTAACHCSRPTAVPAARPDVDSLVDIHVLVHDRRAAVARVARVTRVARVDAERRAHGNGRRGEANRGNGLDGHDGLDVGRT